MAQFRKALSQLTQLSVAGIRNNYDIDQLPEALHSPQLPALLALPIELERERIFQQREDSLQLAAFSGAAKSVSYRLTHLLLVAPVDAGLGLRTHLPLLIDLVDSYSAALAADITLGDRLQLPARVSIEPGVFSYGGGEYFGCAFRHIWLLAA